MSSMPRTSRSALAILTAKLALLSCTPTGLATGKQADVVPQCPENIATALIGQGRLLAALNLVQSTKTQTSPTSASCTSDSDLERRIYVELGDCERARTADPTSNVRCDSNATPAAALLAEAKAAHAAGDETLANRSASRYIYSQVATGLVVHPVSAWLVDAEVRAFAKPDRFLVSHSQGTSYVDGNSMSEVHRCKQRLAQEALVSSQGAFGTDQDGHPLDIVECKVLKELGTVLSFSDDEALALAFAERQVMLWDLRTRRRLWSQHLGDDDDNNRRPPLAGAISSDNSRALVQRHTGDGLLLAVATGKVDELHFSEGTPAPPDVNERFLDAFGFGGSAPSPRFTADGSLVCLTFAFQEGLTEQCWDAATATPVAEPAVAYLQRQTTTANPPSATQLAGVAGLFGLGRLGRKYVHVTDQHWVERRGNEVCLGNWNSSTAERCVSAAPEAIAAATNEPGGLIVAEGNRITRYRANADPSHVMLPFHAGSLTLHNSYDDRWFSGPGSIALWDATKSTGLLVAEDDPDNRRAVRFVSDGVCVGNLCTNGRTSLLARASLETTESLAMVLAKPVAADDWGAIALSTGERVIWGDQDSKDNVISVALNGDGSRAWLLSESGALHSHSTASGKLVDAVELPKCQRDWRFAPASTFVAFNEGQLVIRSNSEPNCSGVLDTSEGAFRVLPFGVGTDPLLSGDGRSLYSCSENHCEVRRLDTGAVAYSTPSDQRAVALSYDGQRRVTKSVERGASLGRYDKANITYKFLDQSDRVLHEESVPGRFDQLGDLTWDRSFSAGARHVALKDELYDYSGKAVARLEANGRGVVVFYPDDRVERLGPLQGPDYVCLVGNDVLPSEMCEDFVESPGRLNAMLVGTRYVAPSARVHEVARKEQCAPRINICGQLVAFDVANLDCDPNDFVAPDQLACLTELESISLRVAKFKGFAHDHDLSRLARLSIEADSYADTPRLAAARRLTSLRLIGVRLDDSAFLSNLPSLSTLELKGQGTLDVSDLESATKLWTLSLDGINLERLDRCPEFRHLQAIAIKNAAHIDVAPLAQAPNLEKLDVSGTPVSNLVELIRSSTLSEVKFTPELVSAAALNQMQTLGQVALSSAVGTFRRTKSR